ncbi:J domain-containing protein [bacterium]|nr:J domain-containing protein [bacterium]
MVNSFSLTQEQEVFAACRVLFGSKISLSRDFLAYLQAEGIRDAYRHRAKATHPDRFPGADILILQRQAANFRRVAGAYGTLKNFVRVRENGLWTPARGGLVAGSSPLVKERRAAGPAGRHRTYRSSSRTSCRGGDSGVKLPQRPLPFGLFLNYSGFISHTDLAKALVWQRRQRPRLGDLSKRWGRLNNSQVEAVLKVRFQGGGPGRFGECAVELGLLSQFQVDTMIHFQRTKQQPLGEYFIEQNLLNKRLINQLLSDLHDHNEQALVEGNFFRRFFGVFL